MKIPKSFVPNEKCEYDLKNLKKPKIKNIETLVIGIEEIWKKKSYSLERHLNESQFNREYKFIEWADSIDNIEAEYNNGFFSSTFYINIIKYLNEDLLKKDLKKVYSELEVYRSNFYLFSRVCQPRVLIVDGYVLFLRSEAYNNRSLNRVENIYRKKFGAKRLVQKQRNWNLVLE